MAVDKQEVPAPVDRSAGVTERQENGSKRLESLLLDDSDSMQAVEHIADQEVKVVGGGNSGRFGLLTVLLLFCIFLFGAGYYYLSNMPSPQPPVNQMSHYVSPQYPIPDRPKIVLTTVVDVVAADEKVSVPDSNAIAVEKGDMEKKTPVLAPSVAAEVPLFTVSVGPFVNDDELQRAVTRLQELGFQSQKKPGRGQVTMIRLLEGIYPAEEAKIRLATLKKVAKSVFLLPDGDKLALYAGSFHQESRARQMQDDLAHEMIKVSLIDSEVTMNGTMLVALQADQQTAREVAAHISSLGLNTQMIEIK
ncbi:MAG: hypothetical protein J7K90_14410 [Desulfuromusa sp.]|nr:hypothetical protein [Desulfuromusa sp.]